MRKLIVLLVSILFTTATYAQTEIIQGVTRGKDFGVVYTLPKTEIKVDIKVTKVTYLPGEFSRYADRYLRLSDVSGEEEQYWELNGITASSVGVPDNENTYFVKMKDKTVAPLMELTEEGLIKSINVPISSKPATKKEQVTPAKKRLDPKDFLTEEILMANSTAKMAELTAKEIYNIRESRNALVRGQADNMPKDGEQLKLMLSSLDEQESAMLELFTGIKNKEEKVFTITLVPNREWDNEVILRFSRKLGVLGANDLAGEPVYLTLKNLRTVTIPEETKKKDVSGIAYNVPGRASVLILKDKNKMFEGELPVTQFGIVEYLAPALFNKNSTIKVTFNPETGALVKVDRE
ncbi:DUF4831 family protein [Bacteroides sp. 51]|uniref:DUF4831 family protein n=1 Tax=Bacteroides sp. 51 TaxID=2302938 RepID=UPI0013D35B9D|nr:DUF4831 family protein [Bacteroides sp. 51]NDV81116.1 DUF4831 family protein [Bacteroides sp. 51]